MRYVFQVIPEFELFNEIMSKRKNQEQLVSSTLIDHMRSNVVSNNCLKDILLSALSNAKDLKVQW